MTFIFISVHETCMVKIREETTNMELNAYMERGSTSPIRSMANMVFETT